MEKQCPILLLSKIMQEVTLLIGSYLGEQTYSHYR